MFEAHHDNQPKSATYVPLPNTVRYNDWRDVDVAPADSFTPTLGVSVVVPYFEAREQLKLTLAGLEGQTYPRELFEVVIVDDGSYPPLDQPPSPLNVKIVHQDKRGFGAARARNNGAREASHNILVFLDGDMIAEAGWLAAHARWHHVLSDALTLGSYARVSVEGVDVPMIHQRAASLKELFSDRESDPPWTQRHMVRTDNLTSRHDDLFRTVTSGNLGIGKAFFQALGGFDEAFNRHGGEDIEFGYRVQNCGGLLVPTPDAFAWHQGRWIENRAAKKRNMAIQRAKLGNLIPHPDFRQQTGGRSFAVPQYVVTVQADQPVDQVLELTEKVLADPVHDLVVRIEMSHEAADDERVWLENQFGPDPRVRVAPSVCALKEFPAAPFHVDLPSCTDYTSGLVLHLATSLGTAVQATYDVGDGHNIAITRTWARHRARRTGQEIQHFGDTLSYDAPPTRRLTHTFPLTGASRKNPKNNAPSPMARVTAEARRIRNIRSAWQFTKWLFHGFLWWAARGRKVRDSNHHSPNRDGERPNAPSGD